MKNRSRFLKFEGFFLFQNIMKDKWMNMGYEEEELKPYVEPEPDYKDGKRIGTLLSFFWQHIRHVICIRVVTVKCLCACCEGIW